ncbi:phosphate/phosphite/phosphonate ABC transporter substrate-binding protein [Oscillatoria salina]|uniref:phosphate/phosphite/phosphonate ABC transporter substrate-binding protein n=1 Tax=Oscillatoria salina TaxID=331517 RepID=UPI0013BCC8ED|nr:phosphate/phosphite/phosphonate ABC transporter substrate-binding protein [Oscillatoria salina]MBZ8179470.1 phosphate/phosphite/phosphonate ABC transporter substrate-binding protein [Oscillatoria salina IIICB1]NET89089.1 phosphate/phosphite/phosphonate ABC transporter substrate-binding protein [Kamptonema sp. SIO1D9]
MKRRKFIWYSLLAIAGCSGANTTNNQTDNSVVSEPTTLRFAVTDVKGLELLTQEYEEFRQKIAEILNKEIVFFPVETYTGAAIALQENQVELVLTGPSEYVIIRSRTNAIPVISITRPNYYSVIAVSADSGIQSLAELKGKTIAMSAIGSTSGYLGPNNILAKGGLDPKSDFETKLLGDEGLSALTKDEVDAWGGWFTDYTDFLDKENLSEQELPVLVKSQPLPNDVLVASSHLNSQFIEAMRENLLANKETLLPTLAKVDKGKYAQATLISAKDSDYDLIREAYEAIGEGNFLQGRSQ